MAKLNENRKILAIGAGGLTMCLAAGGGIWWAKGVVEQVETEIVATEQKIDDAKRKIDQIPDLEKEVIILRENVEAYTKILPEQSEVNDFLRTANRFALQSGVNVSAFLKGVTGSKRGNKYSHYSYRLEIEATLWQFLKFINLFESYDRFVRVVQFDIKPADREGIDRALAEGKDPRHRMALVVETFVYEGKNSTKNVDIPNYAKKREKLASEILAGAQAIELARFDYVEEVGRRDIFVDPRPAVGGANLGDNQRAMQKKTIDEFVQRLAEAQTLHEQWQTSTDYLTKESLARRLRELMGVLEQDTVTAQPKITTQSLVSDWNNQVIQPMRQILRDLRGVEDEAPDAVDEEQLRAILAEMRAAVQRGEYDAATRLHDEVIDRLTFPEQDPRFALALQIQKTKEAVQTIVEFSDIPMKIAGVVVFDEGRSGLLVNGKVYEEGEYLDENLLLKSVGREQADFVFKGFVVRKKW